MKARVRHIHLVGVGGEGMSGLAEILHARGFEVSGCDLRDGPVLARLRERGVRVRAGHDPAHVESADVVVYSSAIPADSPELEAARRAQITLIPRAEMLAELMRGQHAVAISGSHGKTTTTTMVGAVLEASGLDPTLVVGGQLRGLGANSRLGAGELMVVEADESDGSFLRLHPADIVITNVDREHLDHYGGVESLREAFLEFANRIPFWGICVLCIDDANARSLLPRISRRVRSYGLAPEADVRADRVVPEQMRTRFLVHAHGAPLGEISLPLPGAHNVTNALAAIAIGLEFGVPFPRMREALESFVNVARRFERRGERGGVTVVEDYAHNPTKIRAALAAARQAYTGRIVVAFQPHRYTRTRDLFDDFVQAFDAADVLVLTDIYAAGEARIPGVEAAKLAEEVRRRPAVKQVEFVPEVAQLVPALRALARPGDVVLFVGAGDIGRQATRFLEGGDPA
jgi:UDP-N-acetylmuramate--alanine ligase